MIVDAVSSAAMSYLSATLLSGYAAFSPLCPSDHAEASVDAIFTFKATVGIIETDSKIGPHLGCV